MLVRLPKRNRPVLISKDGFSGCLLFDTAVLTEDIPCRLEKVVCQGIYVLQKGYHISGLDHRR